MHAAISIVPIIDELAAARERVREVPLVELGDVSPARAKQLATAVTGVLGLGLLPRPPPVRGVR